MIAIEFLPNKPEKIVVSIRIDKDIIDSADEVAGKLGMSRNEVLCQGIKFALDNMRKDNESG